MSLELVLLVGLPASGKSTFYHERFADTHVHVSKDLIPRSADKAKRQRRLIEEALAEGRSVVVDNTNASPEERAAAIDLAKAAGARVVAYLFDETVPACRERNAKREGTVQVPLVGLYATAKRLRKPIADEGIDAIHVVRLGPEGFIVEG